MTETYKEYNETGDRNIFEDIIDKMILDQVAGMNETFRTAISKLPKDRKRLAILSLLDKDRNLFTKIKDSISNESLSKLDHVKDTVLMLREYVKIAEVEKKKFGEVMTPLDLVKEMLATLPKEVWSNPDLKWLDPANGTGPFPIIVIYKLMKGLEKWQPNEELRYKHIIENMIYTCELQPKNMFLFLCTIDPRDEYDCNIYTGSFLDEGFDKHMKEVWNVDKFDVIIGNPPYQEQKETIKNQTSKKPKTQPLWHKFVIKSLDILNNDKFIVLVHPGGWRNLDGVFKETQNLMKKYQIIYLKIHTFKDGLKIFGAKTNFDYYLLKKTLNVDLNTKIICEDNSEENINITNLDFIPGENIAKIYSLIAKEGEEKVNILHSYSAYEPRKDFISKVKNDSNIYPCVYMVSYIDTPTFLYSNRNDRGHFGIKKVIFASGSSGIILDNNGEYGLTPFSFAIVDDEENFENIKIALKNKNFIEKVMLYKDGLGHKYNHKTLSMLRKDFWKEFLDE